MRLHDVRRILGPAPARLVFAGDDPGRAARRGTLLFVHGFGVGISLQTAELEAIARAGYLAVGLDAVGHGERRWLDFEDRFRSLAHDPLPFFHHIRATAAEIPTVVDALLREDLATEARLGMGGISMGGFVTYRARVVEPRLSLLLPILASPVWPVLRDESPHAFPERFAPAALLSQTAGDDEVVHAAEGARFAATLAPLYAAHPGRLRHVEHEGERHMMSPEGWQRLWTNALTFLAEIWPVEQEGPPRA